MVQLHLLLLHKNVDFCMFLPDDEQKVICQYFCTRNLCFVGSAVKTVNKYRHNKPKSRTLYGCKAV